MFKLTILVAVLLAISGLASSKYIGTYNGDKVDFKIDPNAVVVETEATTFEPEVIEETTNTVEPVLDEQPEVNAEEQVQEETTTVKPIDAAGETTEFLPFPAENDVLLTTEATAEATTEAAVLTDEVDSNVHTGNEQSADLSEAKEEFVPFKPEQ